MKKMQNMPYNIEPSNNYSGILKEFTGTSLKYSSRQIIFGLTINYQKY